MRFHKPPAMFPSVNKLALVIAVIFVLWYALRWLNRVPSHLMRRRSASSPQPPGQSAIEDLVACRTCGTFVAAAGAPNCGKPGCPQPR
jgi:hypothetical protein